MLLCTLQNKKKKTITPQTVYVYFIKTIKFQENQRTDKNGTPLRRRRDKTAFLTADLAFSKFVVRRLIGCISLEHCRYLRAS